MRWVDTPPKDSDATLINYLQNCYNTDGHKHSAAVSVVWVYRFPFRITFT